MAAPPFRSGVSASVPAQAADEQARHVPDSLVVFRVVVGMVAQTVDAGVKMVEQAGVLPLDVGQRLKQQVFHREFAMARGSRAVRWRAGGVRL